MITAPAMAAASPKRPRLCPALLLMALPELWVAAAEDVLVDWGPVELAPDDEVAAAPANETVPVGF